MGLPEILRSIPSFHGLGDDELLALDRSMQIDEHADGHVFIKEGDKADAIFLIVEGEVRVTAMPHGDSVFRVDRKLGPGEIFGVIGLIDHQARSASCSASGPVVVASLPWSAFNMLYNSHAPLAYGFQHLVASQLARDARNLNDMIRGAIHDLGQGNVSEA